MFSYRTFKPLGAILFATATSLSPAWGQSVAYNNGVLLNNVDRFAISDRSTDSPFADQTVSDTFRLVQPQTVNKVRWYGAYVFTDTPTANDDFVISFLQTYPSGNGQPLPDSFASFRVGNVGRTFTGVNARNSGFAIYEYSALLPVSVNFAGGTFALSIVNDTTADTNDVWGWATVGGDAQMYFNRFGPQPTDWAARSGQVAFQLELAAPVPETGALWLMLGGLVLMAGIKKSNQAKFTRP